MLCSVVRSQPPPSPLPCLWASRKATEQSYFYFLPDGHKCTEVLVAWWGLWDPLFLVTPSAYFVWPHFFPRGRVQSPPPLARVVSA